MGKINKLFGKVKEHLKKDGLKDTLYLSFWYICRHTILRLIVKNNYLELKTRKKEIDVVTEKKEKAVYIVAVVPFYDIGGGQRCSQLAKTFHKMGYCVRYLYSGTSEDKNNNKIRMPLVSHAFINQETIDYVKEHVKKEDLFVFEVPAWQFLPLMDIATEKGCKIVYENIDNWETSLGQAFFNEDVLKKMISTADLLVGTAKPLVEQLKQYQERYQISKEGQQIAYLANAVDDELFCGAKQCEMPSDLVKGSRTFLYYGSLWGEWFDWELITGLAERNPEYSINLVGNADGIQGVVRKCPKNLHFLGLKMQAELPAYLQHVDYALLPFKRGEIGDYVSPLKIFEYIAMYTRVLSTSLPDIAGYPNVYFGDTVEEWEAHIAKNIPVDLEAADAFTDENSWNSRVSVMLKSLYLEMGQSVLKNRLAVVILNYNNKNVIFKCINSLLRYQENYNYEIIVVDNGSTDGSYELLQKRYVQREIALYRNQKNGCSSGRNLGVSKTDKEYILFLDSDQWVTNPYWLRAYEEVMAVQESFGAIGWAAGYFSASGGAGYTVDSFPYRNLSPHLLCRSDIGYLGSGGMLMRTADFHAIDGFDIYYDPTCYEDTDISLKMRDYGKEIYYCPYLGVIHLPHQTTNAGSSEHRELTKQKRDYFVNKWKKRNPQLLKYTK